MANEHSEKPPEIILPPRVGTYPPSLPAVSPKFDGVTAMDATYLPPRELCDYYVSRFFQEVHCTHWFYASETFHSRLEATYASKDEQHSPSWLCSLYSIFAIGAANPKEGQSSTNEHSSSPGSEPKTATDYVSLAKQLIPSIYDEADIDSIRALAILVGALGNMADRKLTCE